MLKFLRLLLLPILAPIAAHSEPPLVVTDITPVHALVQAVMQGVGTPEIIMSPGASPHSYSMRPSEAFSLENAALVFWIGEGLTPWLAGPIETLASNAKVITLAALENTETQLSREGAEMDPHMWLEPQNAIYWLDIIATQLMESDPENALKYRANANVMQEKILQETAEISAEIPPNQGPKYITYHDSFQYFERAFSIPSTGWILAGDAAPASARKFIGIRTMMTAKNIRCILSEPGASNAILANIADPNTKVVEVDPLGNALFGQPDMYPKLLRSIAAALQSCPT